MERHRQDYDKLVKPIKERIIVCIGRILPDASDADDALQEALIRIWKMLNKIKQHPNPRALILRICANAALDVLRKKKRFQRKEAGVVIVEHFPDKGRDAAERMITRETHLEIMKAIACLSRKQAQVVIMRLVQELSYESIAQALGCGQSTARKHMQRARLKLKKTLSHIQS